MRSVKGCDWLIPLQLFNPKLCQQGSTTTPFPPRPLYSPPIPSRLFQPRTEPSGGACSQAAGEWDNLAISKVCLLPLRVLQLSYRSQHNAFNNQRFVLLQADSHKVIARLTLCPCSQSPRQFATLIAGLFRRLMSRL